MTRLRFSGTLAIGLLFAGAVLLYSFYQPFIPGAVKSAIPPESTFVYQAGSLEELLQSPVCAQLDKALGAGNSLRALVESGGWSRLAAPSEIAVADIPFRDVGQDKTWAAVSWVGWRSPWLRWKLEHTRHPHFRFLGKHAVWPVWQYDSPDIARGKCLTFSLTDNLFLACLSESPADMVLLLEAYDRQNPQLKRQ